MLLLALLAAAAPGTAAFGLSSSAFGAGQPIPVGHTCDGADRPPPLAVSGTPPSAGSLALVVDDPDAPAGTWVHWVLADVPPTARTIAPGAGAQGKNDFGKLGWGGPCPPKGPAHRYIFKLYALDKKLDAPSGITKAELEKRMEGHVIARAELIGTYARR
jgi:Raf kinase inhibitor-like YbhB/YbcL family protein